MVVGRRDLDDLVVLHVHGDVAAHAAECTHSVGLRLARLVPLAALAQVVLGGRHQRAGRTDGDAVTAIDAGRVRQRRRELGRDVGVEPPAGDGDRERVLVLLTTRVDALVAKDALGVITHVQLVVDLDGLGDGGGRLPVGRGVMAGVPALASDVGRCRRPEPLRPGVVALEVELEPGRRREVDRGGQQLEYEPAAQPNPLGVRVHDHPRLREPRARRHKRARPLELNHADTACACWPQRLPEAQRRRVELQRAAGIEQCRALVHRDPAAIDRQLDDAPTAHPNTPSRATADATAL